MKERPILMSGPMVRAILDGRKTQTRRVVNPQPVAIYFDHPQLIRLRDGDGNRELKDVCHYGQPGDRLWVRETYMVGGPDAEYWYRADCDQGEIEVCKEQGWNWRPSIFMPRRASRITLEIEKVRVERLNEISAVDAIAEGIQPHTDFGITTFKDYLTDEMGGLSAHASYRTLWESINGAGSWAENPWVWVVKFKRV